MATIPLFIKRDELISPSLRLVDCTDYVSAGVFSSSQFRFHDYLTGLPDLNSSIEYDNFNFGGISLSSSITVDTDGAGNIINPEDQYKALTDLLSGELPIGFSVQFINPFGTSYREWYILISTSDPAFNSQTNSVSINGGVSIPLLTDFTSTSSTIDSRNITIYGPDGCILDSDAVSQQERVNFESANYLEGDIITFSFCGSSESITLENDTSRSCVINKIKEAVENSSLNLFSKYLSVSSDEEGLIVSAKIPGVPFNVSMSSSGLGIFSTENVVGNVSNMILPSVISSENYLDRGFQEKGGKYTVLMTVVSECDYNEVEIEFFDWSYDIKNFECCFVSLMTPKDCCLSKSSNKNASNLRNVIYSNEIMIRKNFSEHEIQCVIDFGWSICNC